jgi:hypothetical protein
MSTQAKFFTIPNLFDLEAWKEYGQRLIDVKGELQWELGDWQRASPAMPSAPRKTT